MPDPIASDARAAYERAQAAALARHGSDARSRVLDLPRLGLRAHALVEGDGPPLLLIHGGGGNASNWAPLLPLLARTHRVIAIDRPGCGLTDGFDYGHVDLLRHASDFVADALDALALPRATIVGNSMGALFGAVLARDRPERVERLVAVGSPAGASRKPPLPLRIMATPGLNRVFFATIGKPSASSMRRVLRMQLVARPERVTGEMVEAMWRGAAMPHARRGWRTLLENCCSLAGFRERYLIEPILREVRAPTLFLWGARDAYASVDEGSRLAKAMPDGRLAELPEAGHLPWLDDVGLVAQGIQAFVPGRD